MRDQDVQAFFQSEDIFVLDRGFRDSRDAVSRRNIKFFSPSLETGRAQHTTECVKKSDENPLCN